MSYILLVAIAILLYHNYGISYIGMIDHHLQNALKIKKSKNQDNQLMQQVKHRGDQLRYTSTFMPVHPGRCQLPMQVMAKAVIHQILIQDRTLLSQWQDNKSGRCWGMQKAHISFPIQRNHKRGKESMRSLNCRQAFDLILLFNHSQHSCYRTTHIRRSISISNPDISVWGDQLQILQTHKLVTL